MVGQTHRGVHNKIYCNRFICFITFPTDAMQICIYTASTGVILAEKKKCIFIYDG